MQEPASNKTVQEIQEQTIQSVHEEAHLTTDERQQDSLELGQQERKKFRPRNETQKERRFHSSQWCSIEKKITAWCRKSEDRYGHSPLVNATWVHFPTKGIEPIWRHAGAECLKAFWTCQRKSELVMVFRKAKKIRLAGEPTISHSRVYINPDVEISFLRCFVGQLVRQHAQENNVQKGQYMTGCQPQWWPENLPFSSPNSGENRRTFTASTLRGIISSYNSYYGLTQENDIEMEVVSFTNSPEEAGETFTSSSAETTS